VARGRINQQIGKHYLTVQDIRKYWTVRVYIQRKRGKTFHTNWSLLESVFEEKAIKYEYYQRICTYYSEVAK